MTTQYSPILKLALPVQGELSGTWGDVVNDNITSMVEQAIAGRAVINTWTTNSHTLTSANGTTSESRCAMLELTDTGTALSGAGTVVCPTASKIYIVKNAAGQNITVKTSGGTGILVPNGRTTFLFCDGTNVVEALTHTTSLQLGTSTTVTAVLDEDNMASDSATSLATQQSIKAYVDSKVGQFDSLSEVLAVGNTTGSNNIIVDNGQKITTNTIDETTAGSGVTIDSVLLKDDVVNATDVETGSISANDGTTAATIANSTGVVTVPSAVLTTADINGGTADGVVIGGTTPAAATVTTATANTSLTIAGTTTVTSILDEDNMASDDPAGLATQQSIKAYVDAQVGANNELSEVLANGNTTGGTDIAVSTGDDITFADNSKAIFGADNDLQIFHDVGGTTHIRESGSSHLYIEATNLRLKSSADTGETYLTANVDGAVTLYYDNAPTLATTSTGVDITGTLVSDGLTVDGTATITETGNNNTLTLSSTDADANAGPNLLMFRDSASPADSDRLATITYRGKNDAAQNVDYIVYDSFISDASDGSEDATLDIRTILAGSEASRIALTPVETVINESSNNLDFRVESNTDQYALFVDGGSGGVQMGGSAEQFTGMGGAADGRLSLVNTGNGHAQLGLFRQDTSISGGNTLGEIIAFTNDTADNDIMPVVKIAMTADGTFSPTDNPTKLEFYTTPDASETIRQVGYFNNTGKFYANFGAEINTSQNNPNGDFKVFSSSNTAIFVDAGNEDVIFGGTALDQSGTFSYRLDTDDIRHVRPAATAGDTLIAAVSGVSNGFQISDDTSNNRTYKFHNAGAQSFFLSMTEAAFNEGGNDRDFRVESLDKEKMLFVDGGENVVAMGMLDNYTTPSWIGNSSVVMADNFYQFQGANVNDGVWNQSVDTNQSYHMHNAYYSGGWKQHVANVSATMYQSGSGLHRFQVANANTDADQAISWRVLLNMNEADGFHWNANDYSTADFRVESDSNANMLYVDAGNNRVAVGTGSPQAVFNVQHSLNNSSDWWTNTKGATYLQNLTGHTVIKFNNETGYNASVVYNSTSSTGFQLFDRTSVEERLGTDSNELVINEGSQDFDFRVESDNNTHALFVNAAVSRVGIKTASPDYELQVGDDNTNVDATIAVASAGSSSKRLVFYRASNKDWEIVEDTSENLSINSSGITGKEFVINNASNDTDFRVESDSNTHSMYLDAATDMVNFRTSGSASLQKGGGMDAAINVNGSAYLGSAHYRVISNPNGKVFTLDTASNGAQAFIHLEGSHYNGYRNTYFWATNFSGNWTVYSNTNATSGTTPTYTIGNNSSQNPTITLAFSTGYSGGYVSVRMSNSWSVS